MEQEQDTRWTQSIERINTQRREDGQQIQKLGRPNSIQLTDRYLRITSQAVMHKQIVC
ncbi:PB1-F2 protein [Influenza A virus]|uniref:PB1-F2 protein n=1 Tax=Influenza A virus TaxID=11320 RepID=A0A2U7XWS5_9INFA|nr:PB1-F2 protein [Influenza A virus]AVX27371.1 PB1-F2 protein [Influenza A virus]AVX27379.1 PB1-F2 protein [Influenza A virus]AVX27381.1 PB1-F2 protein [Influenza A virus]AVX27385.1 PB1-F2 protein [Influenza A virus]